MQSMFKKFDLHGPYKLISFELKLSLVESGHMAAIGSILREADVNALPLSSFKSDHLIVPKSELPRAMKVLRDFISSFTKKRSPRQRDK
jgi:hypothetical protein